MLGWLVVVFLILAAAFLLLQGSPEALQDLASHDAPFVAIAAGIVAFYLLTVLIRFRGHYGEALRHLAIWTGFALLLVAAYAYRTELSVVALRMAGELLPPGQTGLVEPYEGGDRAVRIRRRRDGHFVARAELNGTAATLLVDTGASTVVLKPADAERAGIDTSALSYTVAVQTANGTAYAAPVRLRSISVGSIEVRGVEALVARPGSLGESLLGMTFLRRLRSYEFSGEFLTLRS